MALTKKAVHAPEEGSLGAARPPTPTKATHFLLYLSDETFVGAGVRLAAEIRRARAAAADRARARERPKIMAASLAGAPSRPPAVLSSA